ncbi:MAG TPA: SAM-dependent methyltransferase [Rhizomicrobium sp.]|nr:SAM-dependent methyltransferase [Rhizomicrobium sp.]
MNALGERIASLIGAQGPLSVAQFMTIALHDPQAGYYATHEAIGARGDFITAPEVSQMFGELLGLWLVQTWQDQGAPSPARLLELGPGRGTLMADALRAARLKPEFLAAMEIVLVESSPILRKIQEEALAPSGLKIAWAAQFDAGLADKPLFLLANEFFDALPVRQYVRTDRGWCERMVVAREGKLAFAPSPVPTAISIPAARGQPEAGAIYEVSPAAGALAEEIAQAIAARGGAALITDYGYAEAGFGETLQAVGRHCFADVLEAPGDADISAHVNFAEIANAAQDAKAAVFGPVNQGAFLLRLGIGERAARLKRANRALADVIDAAVRRLTDPQDMGTLFKALAIVPNGAPTPPGF